MSKTILGFNFIIDKADKKGFGFGFAIEWQHKFNLLLLLGPFMIEVKKC